VEILTPHDGEVFSPDSDVDVRAVAKSALGVSLFLDGELVLTKNCGCMRTCEVFTTVRPEVGEHTIKAVAWNALHVAEDSVRIDVRKDELPTVEILQPSDGSTITTTNSFANLTIQARASDDKGVTKIEFYIDGSLKYTATTSGSTSVTETYSTSVEVGSHTIVVKAYDTAGHDASDTVTITVEQVSTTTEPTSSSSSPTPSSPSSSPSSGDTTATDSPEIVGASVPEISWSTDFSTSDPTIGV